MNKDNLLFVIVGILIGFVSGYLLFEAMATRQPARLVAGQVPPGSVPPGAEAGAMGQGAPGDPSAGAGAGPAMAQIEELKNRVAQNPNDAEAVLQLAGMNFQIQNWPRAAELFEQYLKMQPGDPNAMTDLGTSYLQAGQVEKSVEVFRQVRQQNPGYWQSYFNEIIALVTLGRMDEAMEVMGQLQKVQPDNPDVQRLAAELERRRTGAS
ncbi:MAG TPA: tetratricopeptide repeat protein [Thermoanaerobaculia bacterium]|nr:tetratricopeptide repeat protein [Thermoanaerobaculia bacterium]